MRGYIKNSKLCLSKAHDAAILAVEVYNKPAIKFKSGAYISLMIIAWTALFHAIFFKRKKNPFFKKSNGRFERHENDYRYWDLQYCLSEYYLTDTSNPIRKNLEFFIPLRNKIEHKSLPELDSDIFGECQAMLLNFDEMIEKEFGEKYSIRESLSFSLQIFPSSTSLIQAVKQNPQSKPIVDFITSYRSAISTEVQGSSRYAFKAFLIQITNHASKEALPIQFVQYDKLTSEQKSELGKFVAMVKYKEINVSNNNKFSPSEVVKKVQEGLGNPTVIRSKREIKKFNMDTHSRCWKKFKARPEPGSSNPELTNPTYCIYDRAHNDYL